VESSGVLGSSDSELEVDESLSVLGFSCRILILVGLDFLESFFFLLRFFSSTDTVAESVAKIAF